MEHLTEEQLRTLKHDLERRQQSLREQIREELIRADNERFADLAGTVHDPGDESVADLVTDINNTLVGNYIRELRDVEAALERIAEGYYAVCDECGSDIPYARLKAYPTALRCVDDQERFERLNREQPGRPSL